LGKELGTFITEEVCVDIFPMKSLFLTVHCCITVSKCYIQSDLVAKLHNVGLRRSIELLFNLPDETLKQDFCKP